MKERCIGASAESLRSAAGVVHVGDMHLSSGDPIDQVVRCRGDQETAKRRVGYRLALVRQLAERSGTIPNTAGYSLSSGGVVFVKVGGYLLQVVERLGRPDYLHVGLGRGLSVPRLLNHASTSS